MFQLPSLAQEKSGLSGLSCSMMSPNIRISRVFNDSIMQADENDDSAVNYGAQDSINESMMSMR